MPEKLYISSNWRNFIDLQLGLSHLVPFGVHRENRNLATLEAIGGAPSAELNQIDA